MYEHSLEILVSAVNESCTITFFFRINECSFVKLKNEVRVFCLSSPSHHLSSVLTNHRPHWDKISSSNLQTPKLPTVVVELFCKNTFPQMMRDVEMEILITTITMISTVFALHSVIHKQISKSDEEEIGKMSTRLAFLHTT